MTGREVLEEIKDAIKHYEKNMGRKPNRIYLSQKVWNVLWGSFGKYMKYGEKSKRMRTIYGVELMVDPTIKGETHYIMETKKNTEGGKLW